MVGPSVAPSILETSRSRALSSLVDLQHSSKEPSVSSRMLPRARWRALRGAVQASPSQILPIPPNQPSRCFSICRQCLSKIGSAPLSLPSGVTFEVLPSAQRAGALGDRATRKLTASQRKRMQIEKIPHAMMSTVSIKGPLGETSLAVPPFVSFDRQQSGDAAQQGRVVVSVDDSSMRRQRAMWGEWPCSTGQRRAVRAIRANEQ